MADTCEIRGCPRSPPAGRPLCPTHFAALPKRLQDRLTIAARSWRAAPDKDVDHARWLRAWRGYSEAVLAARDLLKPRLPAGDQGDLFGRGNA